MTKALELLKHFIFENNPLESNYSNDLNDFVSKLHSEHTLVNLKDPNSRKYAVHFNDEKIGEVHSFMTKRPRSNFVNKWMTKPYSGSNTYSSRKEALSSLFKSHASLHFRRKHSFS